MSSAPVTPFPTSPRSLSDAVPQLRQSHLLLSTADLYAARPQKPPRQYGKYVHVRNELDYDYHNVPTKERQLLQDEIIDSVLSQIDREIEEGGEDMGDTRKGCAGNNCPRLALFTAGGMGAGKGHTLKQFLKDGQIRLPNNFIWVDPDAIARLIPERPQYLAADANKASQKLHPEAALLAEILAGIAEKQNRSLVMDGSLTDCAWFTRYMNKWNQAGWTVEVLFVFAEEETMLARAEKRAEKTGRHTDKESIRSSREKSPECVTRIARQSEVARIRLADNSSDDKEAVIVYDSEKDPLWKEARQKDPTKHSLDVKEFVLRKAKQGDDGRIVPS